MVNNSTNINKNNLSPQLNKWWSTIPPISTNITSHFNSLSETIIQWIEVRGDVCWYLWNCWPSLNELRWEVIFVDIGTIVDHHSMSWEQKSPLTSTHWMMFNNSPNINKNHLLPNWWNYWPSLNELRWEVIFVDIGGIVDISQWVEVRGDFCWYW
jgi:hypothetical protein